MGNPVLVMTKPEQEDALYIGKQFLDACQDESERSILIQYIEYLSLGLGALHGVVVGFDGDPTPS